MAETPGVNFGGVYDPNRDANVVKLQYHRPNLTYRTEGFWVKVNKANPVRLTDYSPRNWATTVKTSATAGDTAIDLNSVKGLACYQAVMFDRGGGGEEEKTIIAINTTTKTITLSAGLTNDQAADKTVDFDRVKVSHSSGVTTIDIFPAGQNASAALAGCDLQNAKAHPDES